MAALRRGGAGAVTPMPPPPRNSPSPPPAASRPPPQPQRGRFRLAATSLGAAGPGGAERGRGAARRLRLSVSSGRRRCACAAQDPPPPPPAGRSCPTRACDDADPAATALRLPDHPAADLAPFLDPPGASPPLSVPLLPLSRRTRIRRPPPAPRRGPRRPGEVLGAPRTRAACPAAILVANAISFEGAAIFGTGEASPPPPSTAPAAGTQNPIYLQKKTRGGVATGPARGGVATGPRRRCSGRGLLAPGRGLSPEAFTHVGGASPSVGGPNHSGRGYGTDGRSVTVGGVSVRVRFTAGWSHSPYDVTVGGACAGGPTGGGASAPAWAFHSGQSYSPRDLAGGGAII